MSLSKKVAYNFSVQFVGKIVNTLVGIVNVAIITRYLGVAGYGDFTIVFAYIMFFSVISDFGFFWIIVKKISAGEEDDFVVKNALAIRLYFAAIVFLTALLVLHFLPYRLRPLSTRLCSNRNCGWILRPSEKRSAELLRLVLS